jgi:uncharacterized protein
VVVLPGRVYVRFYAELNDHLPRDQRQKALEKSFFVPSTVKDIIESLGVPHTEVELIVVNGESVAFSHLAQNGDRIAAYPMFESFDITGELRLRPRVLRETKFILDVHLGKLAAYLRMLGFDAVYENGFGDTELVRISSEQHRILLTRDRGLLKYSAVTHDAWFVTDLSQKLQRSKCERCCSLGLPTHSRSFNSARNAEGFIGKDRITDACSDG